MTYRLTLRLRAGAQRLQAHDLLDRVAAGDRSVPARDIDGALRALGDLT